MHPHTLTHSLSLMSTTPSLHMHPHTLTHSLSLMYTTPSLHMHPHTLTHSLSLMSTTPSLHMHPHTLTLTNDHYSLPPHASSYTRSLTHSLSVTNLELSLLSSPPLPHLQLSTVPVAEGRYVGESYWTSSVSPNSVDWEKTLSHITSQPHVCCVCVC